MNTTFSIMRSGKTLTIYDNEIRFVTPDKLKIMTINDLFNAVEDYVNKIEGN